MVPFGEYKGLLGFDMVFYYNFFLSSETRNQIRYEKNELGTFLFDELHCGKNNDLFGLAIDDPNVIGRSSIYNVLWT